VLLIGVGSIALALASTLGIERAVFFSKAETTTGTVVELRVNSGSWSYRSRRGEYPIVEFAPKTGTPRRCEGVSSSPPLYRVGERVQVYYDPEDPEDARIDSFLELWLLLVVSGGIAALALPVGALVLVLRARRRSLERLRSEGLPTSGTVTRADTSSVEEWGQVVQVLTVRAVDPSSGAEREFRSHRVPGQGDEWLGKQLTIYVDRRKPTRYLVDAPHPGDRRGPAA